MTVSFLQSLIDGAGVAGLVTDTKAALVAIAVLPLAFVGFKLYRRILGRV